MRWDSVARKFACEIPPGLFSRGTARHTIEQTANRVMPHNLIPWMIFLLLLDVLRPRLRHSPRWSQTLLAEGFVYRKLALYKPYER